MFKRKANAKEIGDAIEELLYKLMQNSLYGKSGQKEIIYSFKFIDNDEVKKYEFQNETDLTQTFGNKTLIRTKGAIDGDMLEVITASSAEKNNLYDEESAEEIHSHDLAMPRRKKGSVKSSVSIAAAITAYARVAMSMYKNIPGNKYFGGDTDSVIMEKELNPSLVGKGLGMMKKEGDIKLGLFADKKLYLTIDSEGCMLIKSRGVGRSLESNKDILKFNDYIKLFKGEKLIIPKTKFLIKTDGIYIQPQNVSVKISRERLLKIQREISDILSNISNPLYELAVQIGLMARCLDIFRPRIYTLRVIQYNFVLVSYDIVVFSILLAVEYFV